MNTISVVVPVFNHREDLRACVESLLAQTYTALEILLIDDGSSDGAEALCDEYARRDSRIVVHHQANRGVSAARNWGLTHAKGAYIGFVDGDDWVAPSMYAWLCDRLTANGVDISACGMEEHHPGGSFTLPCKPTPCRTLDACAAFRYMIKGDHYCGSLCNKLYRAELFQGQPPVRLREDLLSAEDLLLNTELLARGATLYYEPEPLYRYRIHAQSAMHTFDARRRTAFPAWQCVVERAAIFGDATQRYAKAMYSQTAAIYRLRARRQRCREDARLGRREMHRYGNALLSCPEVSGKTKIRFVLMALFPLASDRLWGFLRKRLHMKWTAGEG